MIWLILPLYIITSVIGVGALLANLQSIPSTKEDADENYRGDLAFLVGWSLFPFIVFLLSLFLTGFYKHGLQYGRRKY